MNPATFIDVSIPLATVLGYKLSALELIGVITGFAAVWLTAREHVICWPASIVNAVLFGIIFYQVRLYSDMFLQMYYVLISIYGWWRWLHPGSNEAANDRGELSATFLHGKGRIIALLLIAVGTAGWGTLMANVHLLLPRFFPAPAAFPFADGAVAVMSVIATYLLAWKKTEAWFLWVVVDAICIVLYFRKGIALMSIEYAAFLVIAVIGLFSWMRGQVKQ